MRKQAKAILGLALVAGAIVVPVAANGWSAGGTLDDGNVQVAAK